MGGKCLFQVVIFRIAIHPSPGCGHLHGLFCRWRGAEYRFIRPQSRAEGEAAWSLPAHAGAVSAVAAAPDGASFATAGADGSLQIWSAAKREKKASFARSARALSAAAISPDGAMIGAAGDDGVVRVHAVEVG